MLTILEACAKALNDMREKQGNIGFSEIAELPDRWIFLGYGGGAYGNTPLTVDKESGEMKEFPFSILDNYDLYFDKSEPVEVPEEYR